MCSEGKLVSVFEPSTEIIRKGKRLVAQIADVLEDQQRRATAALTPALGMSLRQGLVHNRDHLFVRKHCIGMRHPILAQIAHFLRDKSVAKTQLLPPHLNHAASSAVLAQPVPGAAGHD
jgi:hypothetical protein